jgi:phage tail-like protein
MRWTLTDALPVKWVAPTLRASESAVAVETLELAFQGIRYE